MPRARGGVPERPKGTGCKPVGSAFGGSNPPAPTHRSCGTRYGPAFAGSGYDGFAKGSSMPG